MALRPPDLPVATACELLGIPRSSYYQASQQLALAADARAEESRLRQRIEELCLEFPGYGYRRITAQLRREGWEVNHKRVLRVMREEGLLCQAKRHWLATTQSKPGYRRYPNLITELTVNELNQLWVADLTYIRLRREFIYLAVLMDSYSRRIVGWEVGRTLEAVLCVRALERALKQRQPPPGWIHHSDQGVQYASTAYTELLTGAGAQISMARRGNPYDNAQVESFIKTLKREEVHLTEYRDQAHARERLAHFLDSVYNHRRLHSRLGYRPPAEFEEQLQADK